MTTAQPRWTTKYKQNWDESYKRMMAWWAGDGLDRPLVLAPAVSLDAPHFEYDPLPLHSERDLDECFQLAQTRHRLSRLAHPAESAPFAWTGYGSLLCMLAAMAGASVNHDADTGTAWIGQAEDDLFERPLPQFDTCCPPYAFAIRMIDVHHDLFGFDVVLGGNGMLDPLTTLSMMRGAEALCMDLLERPDVVMLWAERLNELYLRIISGYRIARAAHGRREDYNWTGIWAPGDMDAVQCDFSTMLSPAMFKRYALPLVEQQCEFFDYALWHLDGTQEIRHLDAICSVPNIRAIQWISEKRGSQLEYLDLFRRIRSLGRSLTLNVDCPDEAVALTGTLGKDGLAFSLWGGPYTVQEIEALCTRLLAV